LAQTLKDWNVIFSESFDKFENIYTIKILKQKNLLRRRRRRKICNTKL
jgi:hypothetical protein